MRFVPYATYDMADAAKAATRESSSIETLRTPLRTVNGPGNIAQGGSSTSPKATPPDVAVPPRIARRLIEAEFSFRLKWREPLHWDAQEPLTGFHDGAGSG
jgi:hypothetical protein